MPSAAVDRRTSTALAATLGVVALALALRLVGVNGSLDHDEAVTLVRYVDGAPMSLWQHYTDNNHLLASALAATLSGLGLDNPAAARSRHPR